MPTAPLSLWALGAVLYDTDTVMCDTVLSVVCSKYTQIVGKVVGASQVEVNRLSPAGNNFHMGNYDRAVELMNSSKYSALF